MHKDARRPITDSFTNLSEFMHQFLSMLDSTWMKQTMTKEEKTKTILESMWQSEFYRIGSQILKNASQISVTVQTGVIANAEFKIAGKVDFYINSERQWAVEFLIRGELAEKNVTRAVEHEGRFTKKYAALPHSERLLLDFRPQRFAPYFDFQDISFAGSPPRQKFLQNYWVVVYPADFEFIKITKYDNYGDFKGETTLKLLAS